MNRVSKVCDISKLIVPALECDDLNANPVANFGKRRTNYKFVDVLNAALSSLGTYNSDAAAAAGGVDLLDWYIADSAHNEGVIVGTLRRRLV